MKYNNSNLEGLAFCVLRTLTSIELYAKDRI
jgi:hypothetical protein